MLAQGLVIALVGAAVPWMDRAAAVLRDGGYAVLRCDDPAAYITQLIDSSAVLVLAGADTDACTWIARAKIEQATRRIPTLALLSDAQQGAEALGAGADECLLVNALETRLLAVVGDLARQPDAARRAELDCQCAQPLSPQGQEGVERFNAGEYYRQHDLFEALWMAEPGPVRDLYRAILQVGVAYYHVMRGNDRGALKMLRRSVQWFADLPDVCQGVDVRRLRDDAAQVRAALESGDPGALDRAHLPPVHLVDAAR
ncbi:MAG TPA: DUF309 domain-containing protein [Aggregatilinea sp.]|uniref:DUF309 domain-containing protein n=1 Tax=Aggregatilinea sp. TaxID=2806333 RepID=UPI002C88A112|nr:DUF309 domain-containing protein [Aggregatilinea sp.]HML21116.1 DUF309 domain-containing protein [Aggregatilinea sp.]